MGLLANEDATPDVEAMKNAAEALGIELPVTEDPAKLVKYLRRAFAKRLEGVPKDDWIKCQVCGEMTDDAEELDRCPFCGDDGEEDEEVIDGADLDPEDENAPEEPPAVDLNKADSEPPGEEDDGEDTGIVEADNYSGMVSALNHEKHLIKKAQNNMVHSSYDLGKSLLRIHSDELWKAEGHKNFKKFLETVGVSSTLAYDLMGLVEKFDRDAFLEVGRKRLLIVAKADKEDQERLLDAAKSGATRGELEREVKGKAAAAAPPKEPNKPAPPKEDKITLLAKVGARPKGYKWIDRKTKKELTSWEAGSYVEIKISDTVKQLLALETDEAGNFIGVSVAFVPTPAPAKPTSAPVESVEPAPAPETKATKKATTKKAPAKKATKKATTKKAPAKKATKKATKKAAAAE